MSGAAGTAVAVLAGLAAGCAFGVGTVYGLAAALTLSVTRLLSRAGLGHVLGHWQLWVLAALGTAGLVLSASMLQAGPLSASLPVVDSVEPVSAVLIGTLVFGERLAAAPAGLTLQLAGAAAAVAGIALLGRSSLAAGPVDDAAPSHATGPAGRQLGVGSGRARTAP